MKKPIQFYRSVADKLSSTTCPVLMLIRITLAQVFIESGWGKLHNLSKTIEFFTSLGIPAPQLQAPFVASVEFFGGIAVLLGILTRLVSVPLVFTMVVALITARRDDIHSFSDLTGMIEFLYIILFSVLIFYGPGSISIDAWLRRKFGAEEKYQ